MDLWCGLQERGWGCEEEPATPRIADAVQVVALARSASDDVVGQREQSLWHFDYSSAFCSASR